MAVLLTSALLVMAACSGNPRGLAQGPANSDKPADQEPASSPLYVDASGSDSNPGTADKPTQSIGRALALAVSGQTVKVRAGTYSAEQWPLTLPAETRLEAVEGNTVVLASTTPGSYTGLAFSGNATVAGISLKDFETCIEAGAGSITARGISLSNCRTSALKLSGSAEMRLENSLFSLGALQREASLSGQSRLLASGIDATGGSGFFVAGEASLGIDGATFANPYSVVYVLGGGSTVSVKSVSVANSERTPFQFRDTAAKVSLESVTIQGSLEQGISTFGFTGTLAITGGRVTGASAGRSGIDVRCGTLVIDGTDISNNLGRGLEILGGTVATVRNATIKNNGQDGIAAFDPFKLTLRSSQVTGNAGPGLYLRGDNLLKPFTTVADLGTSTDPGKNNLAGNSTKDAKGNLFVYDLATVPHVDAAGNTWNPSTQGASANGTYPPGYTLAGPTSGLPRNVQVNKPSPIIRF